MNIEIGVLMQRFLVNYEISFIVPEKPLMACQLSLYY